jgi:hypothetical protein
MTPQLVSFMDAFPLFDADGEPVANPGFFVVNLKKGWHESPEDRAQDRELRRLEAQRREEFISRFPPEERDRIREWLAND